MPFLSGTLRQSPTPAVTFATHWFPFIAAACPFTTTVLGVLTVPRTSIAPPLLSLVSWLNAFAPQLRTCAPACSPIRFPAAS